MNLFLLAMGVLVGSGLAALAVRRSRVATWLGAGGAVVGCALAVVPAWRGLRGPAPAFSHPWSVPGGSFNLGIDALSGLFLLPVLVLSTLAALYGARYLQPQAPTRRLGVSWFFYNLLVAAMAMVIVSRNAVLFLVSWEVMAVASFFLVTFDHDKAEVRSAGWTYLVATHLGTAFLLVLFLRLGGDSLDFDAFTAGTAPGLLFLLALVGFGTKAGFFPVHVWLPEAHPAAPSHVSALMSGVMIKTGIYGLLRVLTFLGPPPPWWGGVLIAVGFASGVLGVLFALAQHDLKRLLAYSSVENMGIIALGLGTGLVGVACHLPLLVVWGFGGGLLHVLNHSLFKGLLFLGAGSVAHGAQTREIDQLGGLFKRMPWTGTACLVGATAISGLPPLNGFVGEFLIFLGAFEGVKAGGYATVVGVTVIGGLALVGGLAAVCFAKAIGIVFLGEPRTQSAARAHEAPAAMVAPMLILAAGCLVLGLAGPLVLPLLGPPIGLVGGLPAADLRDPLALTAGLLGKVSLAAGILIGLALALAGLRRLLLRGRETGATVTWGCGYAEPTPRMQYSGSSFVQPLTLLFKSLLRSRSAEVPPAGVYPPEVALRSGTLDVAQRFYGPVFRGVGRAATALRVIQHGMVNVYILYIALTLAVLLIWKLL